MAESNSKNIVHKAFRHQPTPRIPRGELWLGTELLKKADLEDNLKGHIELIKRLGLDLICLPISADTTYNKILGYRYFTPNDLKKASQLTDLFVMAILDGPFQRLTEMYGLMKFLAGWMRERDKIINQYKQEQRGIEDLLDQILETYADAVIIAEDLAGEQGPLISPDEIQEYFFPFHTQAVSKIHEKQSYALLHSCGKIMTLLPQIVSHEFDGLAAIQHRTNDLISLKKIYGSRLTIMAGIDADLLEMEEISPSSLEQYQKVLQAFALGGGFILTSSTGLYSGNHIVRIQDLYGVLDDAG